ncbi:MAG TPA: hypothetical protein VHI52_12575, partial [Verrucomicrobiae bacterium]|nr:hypothetical protein [Verrucomicrobiae bacterium]
MDDAMIFSDNKAVSRTTVSTGVNVLHPAAKALRESMKIGSSSLGAGTARVFGSILALGSFLGGATAVLAQEEGSGLGLWIEAGPVVRGGMRVHVEGSSYVQMLGLHDPNAAGPLSFPSGIGATNAFADRTYDNGYVKLDSGTGNPASPNPTGTWNWGYNDPNQYNASAQTLSFQKQGTAGYNSTMRAPGESDTILGPGLQIAAGVALKHTENWSIDLCLGFQGIWNANQKFSTSTYSENVQQLSVTDVYDVSGIPAGTFPAAGFHGTFLGPFDSPPVVPSPQIPETPGQRFVSVSTPVSTSYNQIDFDFTENLYQFSLGPQITFLEDRGVRLYVRPTVSANIVQASAQRNETFIQSTAAGGSTVLGRWSDHASHQGLSMGLGAVGGFDVDLGGGFFAGGFGGYDWIAKEVNV